MIMIQLQETDRLKRMDEVALKALTHHLKAYQAERERKLSNALANIVSDIITLDQEMQTVSEIEKALGIKGRVYPTHIYKIEGEILYNSFQDLQSYGKEVGFESEQFLLMQKSLLKEVRSILDTECVLGYAYQEGSEKKDVVLFEFPVIATENNRFMPQYDQEMQIPYITV